MNLPKVSIIMPTLNSAKTIQKSLESIRDQVYPHDKIEILVIDGGSRDETTSIAKKYKAQIIKNPQVQPEYAKSLGLRKASGKYAMFLDSDEALENKNSLLKKVELLQANNKCKNIVTTGLICPENYPFICNYINRFGEPFSFFIYKIDGSDYFGSLKDRYKSIKTTSDGEIIKFSKKDTPPIVDGGGHFFDLEFLKKIENINDQSVAARVFPSICSQTHRLGVLNNDYVIHYAKTNLRTYIRKIKWRIISNLYKSSHISGYRNREKYLPKSSRVKKFLFLPYAFSLVLPFFDSLVLSLKYKDFRYFIHLPLTIYTAWTISSLSFKKLIFKKPVLAGEYK